VLPSEFAGLLEDVRKLTDTRGIELLILVWPMLRNASPDTPARTRTELQSEMLAFGERYPLPGPANTSSAIDLIPVARELVKEHGANLVYFDNGHVTPLTHKAIAHAIANHITPWLKDTLTQCHGT